MSCFKNSRLEFVILFKRNKKIKKNKKGKKMVCNDMKEAEEEENVSKGGNIGGEAEKASKKNKAGAIK